MQTMMTHVGGVYADYSLDATENRGIKIHRVYRGSYTFTDPRMVEAASFSIRAQLDGWMTLRHEEAPAPRRGQRSRRA